MAGKPGKSGGARPNTGPKPTKFVLQIGNLYGFTVLAGEDVAIRTIRVKSISQGVVTLETSDGKTVTISK